MMYKFDMEKRNPSMDIIRCLACFLVVSVHFFYNNGFYSEPIVNNRMYVMVYMRSAFMCCVPLFIVLSGYLLSRKKPEPAYYKKLGKTYFIYVFASLACIFLYRFLYGLLAARLALPLVAFDPVTVDSVFFGILDFSAAQYSWYVEMYIGLFLMIPFLNILYNNIPTKKLKKALLLTGIILTALPSVLNAYVYGVHGWWSNPTMVNEAGRMFVNQKIIPAWWTALYPLTYYFIGCYLKEFGLKIKTWLNACLIILTVAASGTYNLWRSAGTTFQNKNWGSWESPFNVILTVLVFAFFMNLKYDRMPKAVKWCFAKVSDLCLGAYLVSRIFDQLFYPVLARKVPVMNQRLEYYFIIVPAVFVCSCVVSYAILKLYQLCSWLTHLITDALRRGKSGEAES